jgi:cyclohexanone monooxygenase
MSPSTRRDELRNKETVMTAPAKMNIENLHSKYMAERDKRLRTDGSVQYSEAKGELAAFALTSGAVPPQPRDALSEDLDVLVVGGGFGGLLTGAELRDAGIDSFRIVEIGADFGGTWYWNNYPGIRCDIESYMYLPRLEEVGTVPSERYTTGRENLEHSQRFAHHYRLYERALLQTKVISIVWHEASLRWHVKTDRGDELRPRFITLNQGPLAKIKLPRVDGIRDFKGKIFHSSRWDYEYTGGNSDGGLVKLAGKRIGVVGNGATGVQILPKLAEHAEQVYLFQRTPSAVAPRNNRLTDLGWYKSLPKGWQKERKDSFLNTLKFEFPVNDLVRDCWTDFYVRVAHAVAGAKRTGASVDVMKVMQSVDYMKMNEVRAHVDAVIQDPTTAESSKPWYNFLCKRPLFSDDYLQAFNKHNVTLVDTDGRGVERITETGLVVNGKAFDLDAIVFATGFDVGASPTKVGEYELIGRNGLTLEQKWAKGVRTVHGTQMAGFPNLHIVGGTAQGTIVFNYTSVLEIQAHHAVEQIAACLRSGVCLSEVTDVAEARWLTAMKKNHHDLSDFHEECTPGFLNNEGKFKDKPTFVGGAYGAGTVEYRQVTDEWRKSGYRRDTSRIHTKLPVSA